jgi:hypothetical protein
LKWFPMHRNFLEMPLTCGIMTLPWNILSEKGRSFLPGFIVESIDPCGYSLSIRLCFMFLISLLKSFRSWHMILGLLAKLCKTSLSTW